MGRKFTVPSLNQKLEVMSHLKNRTRTRSERGKEYSSDVPQISKLWRNENKARKISLKNPNCKQHSLISFYEDVDKALTNWFNRARRQNATINGPILMSKAQEFAIKLKSNFNPTSQWLLRWQKKENIKFKEFHNEADDSDEELMDLIPTEVDDCTPRGKVDVKEDMIQKPPLPPRKKRNDKPSLDEVIKSIDVLRKYCAYHNLNCEPLQRIEDRIFELQISSIATERMVSSQ